MRGRAKKAVRAASLHSLGGEKEESRAPREEKRRGVARRLEPLRLFIGNALQSQGESFSFSLSGSLFSQDLQEEEFPVRLSGALCYLGRSVCVQAVVRAKLQLICDRCLDSFGVELEARGEDEFFQTDNAQEVRASWKESSANFLFAGSELWLDDWVRQLLLLALPSKKLCQLDCRGLCSQCGANKNREACHCKTFQGRHIPV